MNEHALAPVAELPALVKKAADRLASATTAAEVLVARDLATVAYDAAKLAGRLARKKGARDEMVGVAHHLQADALEIEAQANRHLAQEYDAAQERGEVASRGGERSGREHSTPAPTAADLGLTRKEVHEARQIDRAEKADPGIVRRVLDERLAKGEEPTRAALREAVVEAAIQGLKPAPSSPNRNPLYRPPSEHDKAWMHLYGACRALAEWATPENLTLAARGLAERPDDQTANFAAIEKCTEALRAFMRENENVE